MNANVISKNPFIKSDKISSESALNSINSNLEKMLEFLIKTHIKNGGVYYEYNNETQEYKPLTENQELYSPIISQRILPYLAWNTNEYIKKIHNDVDYDLFDFSVEENITRKLKFKPNSSTDKNFIAICLFMTILFLDKFASNDQNKIAINNIECILN